MQKYKQIIRFVIVGFCSTLVNFFVYLILYKITAKISLSVYVFGPHKLYSLLNELNEVKESKEPDNDLIEILLDDLNTPGLLANINKFI